MILNVGDIVTDDLTGLKSVIIGVIIDTNCNIGYRLDNEYLDGLRFPWEISSPIDRYKDYERGRGFMQ